MLVLSVHRRPADAAAAADAAVSAASFTRRYELCLCPLDGRGGASQRQSFDGSRTRQRHLIQPRLAAQHLRPMSWDHLSNPNCTPCIGSAEAACCLNCAEQTASGAAAGVQLTQHTTAAAEGNSHAGAQAVGTGAPASGFREEQVIEGSRNSGQLTRGLGLAPVTADDAIMTAASQAPVAEVTVSVEAVLVTSSNVMAYCGAQASRWMRFCERSRAPRVSAQDVARMLCCATVALLRCSSAQVVALSSPAEC